MPIGESLLTALFMVIVVFSVLIILLVLIKVFTSIIASIARGNSAKAETATDLRRG
ncbi:hypothetical protein AGMMS49992_15960 [Clostridia bacterium]|nr:hypothetical protein AGMMS49992_15960 [Clostridia bacterium]